jgi:hypothetical protein
MLRVLSEEKRNERKRANTVDRCAEGGFANAAFK